LVKLLSFFRADSKKASRILPTIDSLQERITATSVANITCAIDNSSIISIFIFLIWFTYTEAISTLGSIDVIAPILGDMKNTQTRTVPLPQMNANTQNVNIPFNGVLNKVIVFTLILQLFRVPISLVAVQMDLHALILQMTNIQVGMLCKLCSLTGLVTLTLVSIRTHVGLLRMLHTL
jgi:hypothetical protein